MTVIGPLTVVPLENAGLLSVLGSGLLDREEVRALHAELTRFLADQPAPTSPLATTDERSA